MLKQGSNIHSTTDIKDRSVFSKVLNILLKNQDKKGYIFIVISIVLLIAAKILAVIAPFFLSSAVDTLTDDKIITPDMLIYATPFALVASYGTARFLSTFFTEIRDSLFIRVSQHSLRTLAIHSFSHILNIPMSFHVARRTGSLSLSMNRGIKAIDFLSRFMIFSLIPLLLEIIMITTIFYFEFSPMYSLIIFITIVIYFIFTLTMTQWRVKIRKDLNNTDSDVNQSLHEYLLNVETIKYIAAEERETNKYDKGLAAYEKLAIKSARTLSLLNSGQALIISFGLITLLLLATQQKMSGEITIGQFVMLNTFVIQVTMPLNFLGTVYREIRQSLADMNNLFEIFEHDIEHNGQQVLYPPPTENDSIELKNVSFSYNSTSILKSVSINIPAGNVVALVGKSGIGKTTITRLLLRLYDIHDGQLLIGGKDIRYMSHKELRKSFGVIPQDIVLFNDSIHYNITFGNPDASFAEVENAVRMAYLDKTIAKLPNGYETIVGERGLKLSTGEKQRLAIARVILQNPPFLILDEATSSLDTMTEKDIQDSFMQLKKNRTTLIIAHRLSTVLDVDEIYVLDNGIIVEHGDHLSLLNKRGLYYNMWNKQGVK